MPEFKCPACHKPILPGERVRKAKDHYGQEGFQHLICPWVEPVPDPILMPTCPQHECPGVLFAWPQLQKWYCGVCNFECEEPSEWTNIARPR